MLLRETEFLETEGNAPLLMQNHKWLHHHSEKAWKLTRIWPQLLLGRERAIPETTLDDEKKAYCGNEQKEAENYGLQIPASYPSERIHRKDADRTFNTEPKRVLLISMLKVLEDSLGDYQQTMSYVSGILLLFFEPKMVFEMMYVLGRHPRYNMEGYWRGEAVKQGIDAYVLFEIVKKVNPELCAHLRATGVTADTFIQKWFGGLAVQVMPTEHLIEFWTQFFRHGFRYLFKFLIALLQTLSPLLLATEEPHVLFEILRVERVRQFWSVIPGADQCATTDDKVSCFFVKVLGDANSIGKLFDIEAIDFQKEREYAFERHLRKRFMNAAIAVRWEGALVEDKDNEDCALCNDGFGDYWCSDCELPLCDHCMENPSGDHLLAHSVRDLTLNID